MKYLKYFEGVSDRFLYHFTNAIDNILETNRINLSSHLGTSADKSDKFFFLSLSRNADPSAGYGRMSHGARIVFDRDKLKQRFKIVPFDYWQQGKNVETLPSFKEKRPLKDINYEINLRNEFEDRLVTDKAYIDNISKYIDRIELMYIEEHMTASKNNRVLKEIELAKKLGIKVFVYKTKEDMRYARNNIADKIKYQLDLDKTGDSYSSYPEKDYFDYNKLVALFMYDKKYFDKDSDFDEDLKSYLNKWKLDLDLRPSKVLEAMRYLNYNPNEFYIGLSNDFHNFFKAGKSGKIRDIANIFVKQMKQLGVKTIKELLNLKKNSLIPESQKRKDWNSICSLEKLWWNYETEKWEYKKVSPDELFKDNKIYFGTWKYGGQLDDEEWYKIYDIEKDNGTVGDLLNFLLNKYTDKKVKDMIETASYDKFREGPEYKLVKK